MTRTCRVANAPSKAFEMWPSSKGRSVAGGCGPRLLAESTSDVVLGEAVARVREDLVGLPDFDEVAHVEVRGSLRHAGGLLHGVGHDDDRVVGLQLINEVF